MLFRSVGLVGLVGAGQGLRRQNELSVVGGGVADRRLRVCDPVLWTATAQARLLCSVRVRPSWNGGSALPRVRHAFRAIRRTKPRADETLSEPHGERRVPAIGTAPASRALPRRSTRPAGVLPARRCACRLGLTGLNGEAGRSSTSFVPDSLGRRGRLNRPAPSRILSARSGGRR